MSELLQQFHLAQLPQHTEAFRSDVRKFLHEQFPAVPVEMRARSWMGVNPTFSRALATRGWVGVTLPREYGGASMNAFMRFVLVEELLTAGAPVGAHWMADRQSGPLINRFGTATQKAFFLPRICSGRAFFCIGMSEPDVGSDLASVRTRAVRHKSGWRLNGRKLWTTNASDAHFMVALVRTSGTTEDRHQGLSQFIVDLSLPGITIRPIRDLNGETHFDEVLFEDVLLPADALVGEEGAGWMQVNAELAFERSGPERIYSSIVLLEHWITQLRQGSPSETHRRTIGRLAANLWTLRNMSVSVTARLAQGESPLVEAALVKDLGTEFEQSIPLLVEAALGENPALQPDAELIRATAFLVHAAPLFSLRGGTREILRGMIARGLGLR